MIKCAMALVAGGLIAFAQSDLEQRLRALEQKMQQLDRTFQPAVSVEERLTRLEEKIDSLLRAAPVQPTPSPQSAAPPPSAPLHADLPLQPLAVGVTGEPSQERRLPVAGYMDFHFNKNRQEPGQLDFHRFVLLFGHSFSERIRFWSELEVEHAFVEGGEEKGELELEQAYLDFVVKPYATLRAGMLLAPVGLINERHEPPSFHGVERPMVETVIIPSTWFDTGVGLVGDLGRGLRYRAYLMSGLDAIGFSAEEGIRPGRQKGFPSNFRNPAKTLRLEYSGLSGLTLGLSGYTGRAGFNLPGINPGVHVLAGDARYRRQRWEARSVFAHVGISRARELNFALQRSTGRLPNIARQLRGFYVEPAFHVTPSHWKHDLALFTRYERFNTQRRMPAGFVPLPQFDRMAWVMGATYRPASDVAVKFDYTINRSASTVVRVPNAFNLGIGWWF